MWAEEVKKKDPSLILVCVKLFKSTYIYNILFRVLGDGVIFLSPYAVSGINIYILTVQVILSDLCVVMSTFSTIELCRPSCANIEV